MESIFFKDYKALVKKRHNEWLAAQRAKREKVKENDIASKIERWFFSVLLTWLLVNFYYWIYTGNYIVRW